MPPLPPATPRRPRRTSPRWGLRLCRGHRGHEVKGRGFGPPLSAAGLLRLPLGLHIGDGAHHRAGLPGRASRAPAVRMRRAGTPGTKAGRAPPPTGRRKRFSGPASETNVLRSRTGSQCPRGEAHIEQGGQEGLGQEGRHVSSPRFSSISCCNCSISSWDSFFRRVKAVRKAGRDPEKVSSTNSSLCRARKAPPWTPGRSPPS